MGKILDHLCKMEEKYKMKCYCGKDVKPEAKLKNSRVQLYYKCCKSWSFKDIKHLDDI